MNSEKPWPSQEEAEQWVLRIQQKLHRWSKEDEERSYDDLLNLVYDRHTLRTGPPAYSIGLVESRMRGNTHVRFGERLGESGN